MTDHVRQTTSIGPIVSNSSRKLPLVDVMGGCVDHPGREAGVSQETCDPRPFTWVAALVHVCKTKDFRAKRPVGTPSTRVLICGSH